MSHSGSGAGVFLHQRLQLSRSRTPGCLHGEVSAPDITFIFICLPRPLSVCAAGGFKDFPGFGVVAAVKDAGIWRTDSPMTFVWDESRSSALMSTTCRL